MREPPRKKRRFSGGDLFSLLRGEKAAVKPLLRFQAG